MTDGDDENQSEGKVGENEETEVMADKNEELDGSVGENEEPKEMVDENEEPKEKVDENEEPKEKVDENEEPEVMTGENDELHPANSRSSLRRAVSLLATGSLAVWFVVHFFTDGWPLGAVLAGGFVAVDLGASIREGGAASAGVSALILALLAALVAPAIEITTTAQIVAGLALVILVTAGYRYVE